MTQIPRILVVDDQESILENFAMLLDPPRAKTNDMLDELELALGAKPAGRAPSGVIALPNYRMRYARQGLDGVAECRAALAEGDPFSVAFVDVVMPPGIDGVETVSRLWQEQPDLEVVLCTAHSTYSWQDLQARLPMRDQLVILRKPFDSIEVRQLAACLTEKWRRGRALAHRMDQLEAQIAHEVARRLEIELQRSQKFEALGRIAAGIAHEINTPNQYIHASMEFVAEVLTEREQALRALPQGDELVDGIQSAVADALHGVERVTAIVRGIREYAHTSPQALEQVDVNRQVRMAAELARCEYKHTAELVLDLHDVPAVQGHADELGRAVLNLLVNAAHAVRAKSGNAGDGKIVIATRAEGEAVSISVRDTGVGIPLEDRERIFEPFYTTKPLGQGTGQGLVFVRTAVERHRGTIALASVVGEGTQFTITIPIPRSAEVAA